MLMLGNDFSTIYAPLIRDGRMEKFYWDPRKNELVDILFQMYKDDGLTKSEMLELIEAFPRQRAYDYASWTIVLSECSIVYFVKLIFLHSSSPMFLLYGC